MKPPLLRTLADMAGSGKAGGLADRRVLVRVDFNVPMEEGGKITDTTRLEESLPTVQYLVGQGAKVILLSHLGRPRPGGSAGSEENAEFSLRPVGAAFSELLGKPVGFVEECVGPKAEKAVRAMNNGKVILLENTRFHKGEEKNDPNFAKQLAALGEVFVSDAFGTVHRAHASTVGVAAYLPSYAGLLLEKEIRALTPLLKNPAHPVVLIVGGAKIDTKIGVLKNFLNKADTFIIGGGLANTFLAGEGYDVGASLYEKDKVEVAQEILLASEKAAVGGDGKERFLLPQDVVVADEAKEDAEVLDIPVEDVELDMRILDIGRLTTARFVEAILRAKTIIWNGPVGLYEMKPFERGTREITKAVAAATKKGAVTVLGGGDTIDAIKKFGHSPADFTHVSTGGGAMLEFLESKTLPGIAALYASASV